MLKNLQTLLPRKYHTLWQKYCQYLHMGWQHFSASDISFAKKKEKLRLLEKALRCGNMLPQTLPAQLQKLFLQENLSLSILLEPMQTWQYLSGEKLPDSNTQIFDIIAYTASPSARLIMALNNENPSTYLPMTSLLSALIIREMIFNKSPLLQKVKYSPQRWHHKLLKIVQGSYILLTVVKSKRLKWRLAILLNTVSCELQKNNKQSTIDWLDRIKIICYSTYQFITIKRRTTNRKGL